MEGKGPENIAFRILEDLEHMEIYGKFALQNVNLDEASNILKNMAFLDEEFETKLIKQLKRMEIESNEAK